MTSPLYRLYRLNRDIDEVEAWITDREGVASLTDLGTDLEHNDMLHKKFDGYCRDLSANETRCTSVNNLGCVLIEEGHSGSPFIEDRLTKVFSHTPAPLFLFFVFLFFCFFFLDCPQCHYHRL